MFEKMWRDLSTAAGVPAICPPEIVHAFLQCLTAPRDTVVADSRRAEFEAAADEFIARIQAADLSTSPEVRVTFLLENECGEVCEPFTAPIVCAVRATGGSLNSQLRMAQEGYRVELVKSINESVRFAPLGYFTLQPRPEQVVRIRGFEMEIDAQS
ncbi:MAG TPA: hypothetical protein VH092_22420 [Urbifossiella sp.]|nr:hypothetical protein [Urbifossiella sp.]